MKHSIYSSPLVIAIMAFAVVAFLFLIDTAINPDGLTKNANSRNTNRNTNVVACTDDARVCPDGSAVGRTGSNCEFAECPKTNTNTTTNSNINSSTTSTKPSTDVVDSANKNVHTYTSYKLGVQFNYWSSTDDKNGVLEKDNRIYVYYINTDGSSKPTEGQWVEVYTKASSQTLSQAVTADFLSEISPADCFLKEYSSTKVVIDFPHTGDLGDVTWNNREKCPSNYTVTNGGLYFWADETHQTKYAFFWIGQYGIKGTSDQIMWQDTFTFLD